MANEIVRLNYVSRRNIVEITPFNLVTGSYQGMFKYQGIPSSASFITAILANRIDAEDLVRSAIAKGRLSEDTLNDTSYLNRVESLMNGLDKN
ncbi:MAG: hypothetical protein QNJ32_05975 [Xenococcaceae cyanobacterium MO_167.B27]|nr:hypothetical protein [Xenococcaceae cyanobacterium MO_167.B27]